MCIGRRIIVARLIASALGLLMPCVMILASAWVYHFVDPTAWLRAFLLLPPHHPIRLAVSLLALNLGLGAFTGLVLSLLRFRFCSTACGLLWIFFITGFLVSLLVLAPHFCDWTRTFVTRIGIFVISSAIAVMPNWCAILSRKSAEQEV
jgi:hypothetical protein